MTKPIDELPAGHQRCFSCRATFPFGRGGIFVRGVRKYQQFCEPCASDLRRAYSPPAGTMEAMQSHSYRGAYRRAPRSAEVRYHNDPLFKAVVQELVQVLASGCVTGGDLADAVEMAMSLHAERVGRELREKVKQPLQAVWYEPPPQDPKLVALIEQYVAELEQKFALGASQVDLTVGGEKVAEIKRDDPGCVVNWQAGTDPAADVARTTELIYGCSGPFSGAFSATATETPAGPPNPAQGGPAAAAAAEDTAKPADAPGANVDAATADLASAKFPCPACGEFDCGSTKPDEPVSVSAANPFMDGKVDDWRR